MDCQPSWGSPSAPPQGIIADGDDGSHWVTVDDKGILNLQKWASIKYKMFIILDASFIFSTYTYSVYTLKNALFIDFEFLTESI